MKISIVFLLIVLQINATGYAQNISLDLNMSGIPLREVFKEIERKTELSFIFSDDLSSLDNEVSINVTNKNVRAILNELFKDTDLGYEILNERLIIVVPKSILQQITVTGTVTDGTGETLPGVNVTVSGTTIGTVTDGNGRYSINVPEGNAILVFSSMGFAMQEIAVGNQTQINVALLEDASMIEELIVVGYGVQKRINLTGSVSTIGSDRLVNRPTPNFATSLAGLASGVQVTQTSGDPGNEAVSIQIRGLGSINGGSPMILVDGVIASMDVINPDDVESISILKDAASAAIYGSRAAHGVVLVTTKKGKKEKPTVTASAMFAREKAVTSMRYLSDMPTFMRMHNLAARNNSPNNTQFPYAEALITEWEEANKNPNGIYTHPVTGNQIPNWLAYPNTDWATVMFQPTMYHRYSISVSGGSENTTYMLSGSFQDNPGTLENTGQKRFNIRANVESKIANFLTVGTQTYAIKEFKEPGSVNMAYLHTAYPGITPKYQGLYGASEDLNNANRLNQLQSLASTGGQHEYTRINSTWYANADIWNGISAEARFNYSEYQTQSETYIKNMPLYRFREGTEYPVEEIRVLENVTSSRSSYFSPTYTANLILRYAGSFGEHDINAFAAYEQYYIKSTGFSATKRGLLDWNVTDITSAATMESIGGAAKQELVILSYFGRLNYAYKNRYLFEANFRADGSSRFAPGHRWGTFSAFSAGWRISEESFFEPLKIYVDNLKLKASYGELGNQISGYYDWQFIYAKTNAVMNQSVQSAVVPSQMPNFLMSWEKTATTNVGFESNFLKQRLSLEVEYYTRKTTDMLVQPSLNLTMGNISLPQTNAAAMTNKGFDMSVGWNDRIGNLRYSVNANIAYSVNEITKYQGKLKYEEDTNVLDVRGNPTWRYTNLADASTGGNNRVTEGHTYNEFFLRNPYKGTGTYTMADGSVDPNGGPKDGMIRSKADLDWVRDMIATGYSFNNLTVYPEGSANLWYGELLMEDANGDGRYGNDDDRVFIGKMTLPKWTFGLNLSAEWKGIDISMFWAGRLGSYHYINAQGVNNSNSSQTWMALPANSPTMFYTYDAVAASANGGVNDYDPVSDPNANYMGKYPRQISAASTIVPTSFYLYNTSFLKLKSLQVGYFLPKKWLDAAKIENMRVFISGENLLTIQNKDFLGVDPELGAATLIYPIAKIFSGGVTITF